MKVTIIGAGIGGLATAIALQKAGHKVEVYEAAPVLRGVGAGISLWSNATSVLERLGLFDEAVNKGAAYTVLKIRSDRGKLLLNQDVGKYTPAAICLHRADLIDLLRRSCASETIHLGKSFERFEQSESGILAFFADGTTAASDILIGADGINSQVRAQIKGDSKPVYRGYAVWRGIIEYAAKGFEESNPTETWGRGKRFGFVPIGENRFYWYATNNQPAGEILLPDKRKKRLLELFRDWHAPIPQILAAMPAENILHNDCYDRPPEKGWSHGRVCLIGDAAHPTTPNMGQGGCLALEDALVLTPCLQNALTAEKAFGDFENSRFARTKLINRRSLLIGSVGQWSNPISVGIRNVLIKLTTQKLLERTLDGIYNFDPRF